MHVLGVTLDDWEGTDHEVVLTVDGVPLTDLVARFAGEDPSDGGYGGRVLSRLGRRERTTLVEADGGELALLICDCGETGCWSLLARVGRAPAGTVRWDSFRNPHLPDRDHSGLGPFEFDPAAYRNALAVLGPPEVPPRGFLSRMRGRRARLRP